MSCPRSRRRSRRSRVLLAVPVALLALGATGCGADDPPVEDDAAVPSYTPVPDEDLYAQIADLPGVRSVQVEFARSFGNSNTYVGTVTVAASADATGVLDQVLAILRQGRPGAKLGVSVDQQGEPTTTPAQLGLYTQADVEARYGPQPGDGAPPDP